MRGKQCKRPKNTENYRITPADAGKTMCGDCSDLAVGDHPRGCGENDGVPANFDDEAGSPPRMRGKQPPRLRPCAVQRITPADAGKTTSSKTAGRQPWDHPRGCGENAPFLRRTVRRPGSPPRMRGKPDDRTVIIGTNVDHPRGCGENLWATITPTALTGSPPRMRGKPHTAQTISVQARITPADAGKTRSLRLSKPRMANHPRGCGENKSTISST